MGVFDKFSGIGVASGFKLQAKAPIDPRQVVDTIDDRDALITENGAYEGMQVYVKADKKTYLLKDLAAGTWEELGSGGGASELLTIEISVSITETTADVLKTYLNNNPDVLAELEAASSFILKVNKQNIATPDTYVFEQNYKNITTGAQHYFICVHAYGKDTTRSVILWFSVVSRKVEDITMRYHELRSGIPDYNQNDSTAASYIRNRPFYDSSAVLFDENITTEQFEGTIYFWETTNKVVNVNAGDEIKIIFNGVEYTQTVKANSMGNYVGNQSILGLGVDTKEPFFITLNIALIASEGGGTIVKGFSFFAQTAYNGEVKITTNGVKTMDAKYLPNGTATESYVNTAISNAITKTLNTEV